MKSFLIELKVQNLELIRGLKHTLLDCSEEPMLQKLTLREIQDVDRLNRAIDIALAGGGFEDMMLALDLILEGIDYWIPRLPEAALEAEWRWRAGVIHLKERMIASLQIEADHKDILRKMNLRKKPKRVTLN